MIGFVLMPSYKDTEVRHVTKRNRTETKLFPSTSLLFQNKDPNTYKKNTDRLLFKGYLPASVLLARKFNC